MPFLERYPHPTGLWSSTWCGGRWGSPPSRRTPRTYPQRGAWRPWECGFGGKGCRTERSFQRYCCWSGQQFLQHFLETDFLETGCFFPSRYWRQPLPLIFFFSCEPDIIFVLLWCLNYFFVRTHSHAAADEFLVASGGADQKDTFWLQETLHPKIFDVYIL